MFMAADEFPLPYEYRFFRLDGPRRACSPTTSRSARSCSWTAATSTATRRDVLKRDGAHILNIDHHHDNTRFGTVNHVVPEASCTAEIVWDLMRGLGVEPTLPIAEALYVGLVTDTGKFMYENTGTRAHVMAAELIDAGVDVHEIYRRLYEGIPYGKLELLARGLAHVERYDGGALTLTHLTRGRLPRDRRRGELLRGRRRPPALGRGHGGGRRSCATCSATDQEGRRKVSLRATDDRVDVSRDRPRPGRRRPPPGRRLLDRDGVGRAGRVPARRGRGAALASPVSVVSCRVEARDRLDCDDVRPADRQAAPGRRRTTSSRAVRRARRRAKVGHAGHARPVRDRPAARARRPRDARAALPHGAAEDLRGRRARFGAVSTTGDPEGEIVETGVVPPEPLAPAHRRLRQRPPAYSAVKVGRRARLPPARRGEAVEMPERDRDRAPLRAAGARGRPRRARDRVLVGHLRALADRRPRRRLLRGAAAHRDRAVPRAGRRPRATRRRWPTRWPSCPSAGSRATTRAARSTASPCPAAGSPAPHVRLTDADGLIAVAEPRPDGMLKPTVGFRGGDPLMKITYLPDVEPRPRRVAVGEFDGVHLGHREVIARQRHRADLRAAPARGHPARGRAQAAHPPRRQGRAGRGARRRGAGGDPVRRRLRRSAAREEFIERVLVEHAAGDARLGRAQLPLRAQGAAATRRCWRADERFETRVVRPRRGRGRDRLLEPHPRAGLARARSSTRSPSSAGRSSCAARSSTATGAGASSASRPPTSCPTSALVRPDMGVYAVPRQRRRRRRSTSACGRRSRPAAGCCRGAT